MDVLSVLKVQLTLNLFSSNWGLCRHEQHFRCLANLTLPKLYCSSHLAQKLCSNWIIWYQLHWRYFDDLLCFSKGFRCFYETVSCQTPSCHRLLNESKAIQWQITFCCHCTKNPSATGIARKLLRRWGLEQEKAHPHLTFAWRRCTSKSHTMSVQFNRFSSCSKCHPEDGCFAPFQLILNTFRVSL